MHKRWAHAVAITVCGSRIYWAVHTYQATDFWSCQAAAVCFTHVGFLQVFHYHVPPPIPSVPPSTPQPFIVLCWRIVQWKIYDSFSNYPQLSAICACIDGDCHHGDLSDWACAGGRAEAERLDFHSFGAGGHKDNGVAHTCWVIIQYKKDDNRRGLASQAYTKASMTKMRSGTTFSFAQWPLTF